MGSFHNAVLIDYSSVPSKEIIRDVDLLQTGPSKRCDECPGTRKGRNVGVDGCSSCRGR